jgi:hypothetical protein
MKMLNVGEHMEKLNHHKAMQHVYANVNFEKCNWYYL